ncbi:MAG: ATP-binding cassette domain-containing protein [Candidatus Kapabacteria bacterium]|nr:ATP-binding cassette domain-containing protein [Candidatus Kapabacteria bacterium]
MRIELIDVTYRSAHGPIITNAPLSIESPSIAVIVGPTGSGKSLLHAIMRADVRPTTGDVLIDSTSISGLSASKIRAIMRRLGIISTPIFHEDLNLFENMLLVAAGRGLTREEATTAALEGLADVGLSHRRTSSPSQLSSGEKLQAGVAQALLGPVEMILVDDPFRLMDEASFRTVFDVLTSSCLRRGIGMIVTTTDPLLAQLIPNCDRYELRDGVLSSLAEVA